MILLAVTVADGQVSGSASAVGGAVGALAAEAREVVHVSLSSQHAGWVDVQGFGSEMLDILRSLIALCSVIQGHLLNSI